MAARERHNIQECKDMIGREDHMRRGLRYCIRRSWVRLRLCEGDGRVGCPNIAERASVGRHDRMDVEILAEDRMLLNERKLSGTPR